ncbi:MAG: glycosyltransferase family 2 protein [Dysgonomonas sp.]|uniref:glycosyltransferase family 2 protein n=1 Tax=Dysgonomonas sp. TaxID=1891233 RepID=UPI003A83F15C
MSLFSIIIPTFNSSLTIRACIKSVLDQTFSDFEILIMDGVSNDETLDIIESYNDKRIHIYSEKDSGIYDAMNKGVDKAKGEWLYFIGSDDKLYNNTVLETVFLNIRKTKKKIIYGSVEIVGDSGWAKDGEIYDGYFNLNKLLRKNICHQAIFYKKSIFKKMGYFNTSYVICADYDFNLKCYSNYGFLYLDIIIAKFRGGNTSFIYKDLKFEEDKWANIAKYNKWYLYNRVFESFFSHFLLIKKKGIIIRIQVFIYKIKPKLRAIKHFISKSLL